MMMTDENISYFYDAAHPPKGKPANGCLNQGNSPCLMVSTLISLFPPKSLSPLLYLLVTVTVTAWSQSHAVVDSQLQILY
jgi:hypothetical protein